MAAELVDLLLDRAVGGAAGRVGTDVLSGYDYLWRWDTDWFWCSGAFGLHDPRVRRLWPRRWRRSDVYYRLVGLDTRFGIMRRLDARAGRPERERVVQDIEVPVERLPEFLKIAATSSVDVSGLRTTHSR